MTPGDPTEQLPQVSGPSAGSSGSSSVPKFPMRPEDVDKARAQAKAAKEAAKEADAKASREAAAREAAARSAAAAAPKQAAPSAQGGASAPAAGAAGAAGAVATSGAAGAAVATGATPTAPRPAAKPAARPAGKAPAAKAQPGSGRRVRLTLSRIDPWSALKMSFLLSVALGIAMVVATAALWLVLAGMGAFDQVNNLVGQIVQDGDKKFDIMDFVGFGRVVSLSIVFAVIDVFLITAIATLGAFIYNVSSSLVGGLHLTLTDD